MDGCDTRFSEKFKDNRPKGPKAKFHCTVGRNGTYGTIGNTQVHCSMPVVELSIIYDGTTVFIQLFY